MFIAKAALIFAAFTKGAKFPGSTSADPMKIHNVFVSAFGANTLHFHFVKINIIMKSIRFFGFNSFAGQSIVFSVRFIYNHMKRFSYV
jgi:hypothetical protein